MAKITDVYNVLFNVNDKKYKAGMKRVEDQTKKTQGRLSKITQKLGGLKVALLAATVAMGAFVKSSISAYREQEKAERQLEAAAVASSKLTKSMVEDIKLWAAELQKVTTVGDETSLMVARIGITAANLGRNQIKPFMRLVADMAAGTGRSVTRVSRTLSGALADPIEGLTTLEKQGLKVDDAFKEQIKTLVESGNQYKAVDLIMGRLNEKYEGQAASIRSGAGAFDVLKNSTGDLLEQLGRLATNVLGPLALHVSTIVDKLTDFIKNRGEFIDIEGEKHKRVELITRAEMMAEKGSGKFAGYDVAYTDVGRGETFERRLTRKEGAGQPGWGVVKGPNGVYTAERMTDQEASKAGVQWTDKQDQAIGMAAEAEKADTKAQDAFAERNQKFWDRNYGVQKDFTKKQNDLARLKADLAIATEKGWADEVTKIRKQVATVEKEIGEDSVKAAKAEAKAKTLANLKYLRSTFKESEKVMKAMDAMDAAMELNQVIRDIATKPGEAFGATVAKGGFWSIPLAITTAAATVTRLGAALAGLNRVRKFHRGGLVDGPVIPGSNDEVFAVLQKGERVIPREQAAMMADSVGGAIREGMGGMDVNIELVGDAGKLLQVVTEDRINEGF